MINYQLRDFQADIYLIPQSFEWSTLGMNIKKNSADASG
jgi:hypothetical protein